MKKRLGLVGFLILIVSANIDALVILQYHHVSDTNPKVTSISPALFAQHLDYLSENDFKVISLSVALDSIKQGTPMADKTLLITFDDGYRSIINQALPLLKAKGFPFTVFVSTGAINQGFSDFMSWQELQTLVQHGASIANHTVSHPHMVRRKSAESVQLWTQRMTGEIEQAQSDILKYTGQNHPVIAYPFGEYSAAIQGLVQSLGYIAMAQHSGSVLKPTDLLAMARFAIPRFAFGGSYGSMEDFKIKVNSLPMPIESLSLADADDKLLRDHVLAVQTNKPKLHIRLNQKYSDLNVQCYLSGQGAVMRVKIEQGYTFQSTSNLPVGRSRFNCTAASDQPGRFYWYSQPWLKSNVDGSWPPE